MHQRLKCARDSASLLGEVRQLCFHNPGIRRNQLQHLGGRHALDARNVPLESLEQFPDWILKRFALCFADRAC